MARFLSSIGFIVQEGMSQLGPHFLLNERKARVRRAEFEFLLEEDTSKPHAASFSMTIGGFSEEEIKRAISGEFEFKREETLYGEIYVLTSPDGGTFLLIP